MTKGFVIIMGRGEGMRKVLFFDIDGTLTDIHGGVPEIPVGAKRKMKELQKQGHLLFLASGRPYAFIPKMLTDFGFDGAVLCNGAHVEMNGEFIYHQTTDLEKTKNLVRHLHENNFEYIIETKRGAYLDPQFKVLEEFFISCNINEDYLIGDFRRDEVIKDCLKLEASVPAEYQTKIEEIIQGDFNYDKHGTENAFEIYSNVISKATGVQKVLEHLNLQLQDSYAFGDGLNDLEMIKTVGTGVAMGNAVAELKAVSDIVCDTISNNGLEKVLTELFG